MRHLLSHIAIRAALVGLTLVSAPGVAHGLEIFGIRLFGEEEPAETGVIDPLAYSVELQVTGGNAAVEEAVKNASSLWSGRDEPASGATGLLVMARGDYRRILAALYSEGYYGGSIAILVDGREAAELAADAALSGTPEVLIRVEAGPQFRFRTAEIVNPAPPPATSDDDVEDPAARGYAPGEVARSEAVLRAERLAREAWRQQGHAKAEAAERRVVADHPSDSIEARIVMRPGPRAAYGEVGVRGARRMNPAFVARQTGLKPGQEYDPDDLERARERLARLEVFRSLRLEEAEDIGDDGLLPIDVVVEERPLRRIGAGASYSTVDGAGIEAYWLHRNLFGQAERLRFDMRLGGIATTEVDPEEYDYELSGAFLKPGVFTPDTDFLFNLKGERSDLERYRETSVRGESGFRHIFSEDLSGRALVNAERAEFEDDLGIRRFTTLGLETGLLYDSRDSKTDPTGGLYGDLVAEPFYEFDFDNAAFKLTAEARGYLGFGAENRLVAAARVKAGSLVGPSSQETPPDRLYFAGGGGSVRGYPYRGIGVETGTGETVGGRSLIEGSLELRARITESFGLVGFVDAGYVSRDSLPGLDEDLLVSAGLGIRYYTSLGPLRLDVALPLDPRPGDPDYGLYVGIGQAF